MASPIPTSTSVSESAVILPSAYSTPLITPPQGSHSPSPSSDKSATQVIAAPLAAVWHLIKLPSFPAFWSALQGAEEVKGTSPETDIVKWSFKDGTELQVKQEEHSVRAKTALAKEGNGWIKTWYGSN